MCYFLIVLILEAATRKISILAIFIQSISKKLFFCIIILMGFLRNKLDTAPSLLPLLRISNFFTPWISSQIYHDSLEIFYCFVLTFLEIQILSSNCIHTPWSSNDFYFSLEFFIDIIYRGVADFFLYYIIQLI